MKGRKKVAVVDIGTNSVRLMVAEATGREIERVLYQDGRITRLGEGIAATRTIARGAVERTSSVLTEFSERIRSYSPDLVAYVGTSALRQASNREEVLERFFHDAGVRVRVIPGEEEAALTYRGALLGLSGVRGPFLVVDIGGGSSELIVGESSQSFWKAFSVEVGVVTLTEGWFRNDPPLEGEFSQVRRYLEERFRDSVGVIAPYLASGARLVGTAGSVTTILALIREMVLYDPAKVHGQRLTQREIDDLFKRLRAVPSRERLSFPGLERGREDIILSGTFILLCLLDFLRQSELTVSSYGLREGVVLDLAGGAEGLEAAR